MINCVFTGAQVSINDLVHAADIYQMPSNCLIIRFNPSVIPLPQVQVAKLVILRDEDEYQTWFQRDGVAIAEFDAVVFNRMSLAYAKENGMRVPLRGDS